VTEVNRILFAAAMTAIAAAVAYYGIVWIAKL
jgi:hypothetical protein